MGHRTALITAGSIAAVIFAAAVAVGANLGILNAADSRPVGKLSAAMVVQTSPPKVVPARVAAAKAASTQKYIIKKAGVVSLTATKTGVRLVKVSARHGWRWTLTQTANKKLSIAFHSNGATLTFLAVLGRHSSIVARVDQQVTKVTPAPPSSSVVAYSAPPATAPAPTHSGESDHGGGGGGADD